MRRAVFTKLSCEVLKASSSVLRESVANVTAICWTNFSHAAVLHTACPEAAPSRAIEVNDVLRHNVVCHIAWSVMISSRIQDLPPSRSGGL